MGFLLRFLLFFLVVRILYGFVRKILLPKAPPRTGGDPRFRRAPETVEEPLTDQPIEEAEIDEKT